MHQMAIGEARIKVENVGSGERLGGIKDCEVNWHQFSVSTQIIYLEEEQSSQLLFFTLQIPSHWLFFNQRIRSLVVFLIYMKS